MKDTFDRGRYDRALEHGARQYDDVIQTLRLLGYPVEFTQTGGMCAALHADMPDGTKLLITDAENDHEGEFLEHTSTLPGSESTHGARQADWGDVDWEWSRPYLENLLLGLRPAGGDGISG